MPSIAQNVVYRAIKKYDNFFKKNVYNIKFCCIYLISSICTTYKNVLESLVLGGNNSMFLEFLDYVFTKSSPRVPWLCQFLPKTLQNYHF